MDTAVFTAVTNVCCGYCELYADMYQRIANSGRSRWLTVSPPYDDEPPAVRHMVWLYRFLPMIAFADEFILVVEFSEDGRLHYHCIYSRIDEVKEYIYINGWRRGGLQVKVYDGEAQKGCHYLFKDIERSGRLLGGINVMVPQHDVVHTRLNLRNKSKSIRQTVEMDYTHLLPPPKASDLKRKHKMKK